MFSKPYFLRTPDEAAKKGHEYEITSMSDFERAVSRVLDTGGNKVSLSDLALEVGSRLRCHGKSKTDGNHPYFTFNGYTIYTTYVTEDLNATPKAGLKLAK